MLNYLVCQDINKIILDQQIQQEENEDEKGDINKSVILLQQISKELCSQQQNFDIQKFNNILDFMNQIKTKVILMKDVEFKLVIQKKFNIIKSDLQQCNDLNKNKKEIIVDNDFKSKLKNLYFNIMNNTKQSFVNFMNQLQINAQAQKEIISNDNQKFQILENQQFKQINNNETQSNFKDILKQQIQANVKNNFQVQKQEPQLINQQVNKLQLRQNKQIEEPIKEENLIEQNLQQSEQLEQQTLKLQQQSQQVENDMQKQSNNKIEKFLQPYFEDIFKQIEENILANEQKMVFDNYIHLIDMIKMVIKIQNNDYQNIKELLSTIQSNQLCGIDLIQQLKSLTNIFLQKIQKKDDKIHQFIQTQMNQSLNRMIKSIMDQIEFKNIDCQKKAVSLNNDDEDLITKEIQNLSIDNLDTI